MNMAARPHWDNDLVEAVRALIPMGWGADGSLADDASDAEVYPVIAAVEDWHRSKRDQRVRTHSEECWRWHQECAEAMIERLSGQVEAVQELQDRLKRGQALVPGSTYRNYIIRCLDEALEVKHA